MSNPPNQDNGCLKIQNQKSKMTLIYEAPIKIRIPDTYHTDTSILIII